MFSNVNNSRYRYGVIGVIGLIALFMIWPFNSVPIANCGIVTQSHSSKQHDAATRQRIAQRQVERVRLRK